jgi:hypothetical protein
MLLANSVWQDKGDTQMNFYVDRTNKRFNPHATITVLGVVYEKGDILKFPDAVAFLGIKEIQEPDSPAEYKTNPDYYFRTESETFPYVIYLRKSDEQIAQVEEAKQKQADKIAAKAETLEDVTIKYLTSHTAAQIVAKVKTLLPSLPPAEAAVIGRLAAAIGSILRD